MTNLILPSILVATVLLAGAFAFMPVDEAQAVHTTIQGTQMTQTDVQSGNDLATDGAITCDSDADFTVFLLIGDPVTDGTTDVVTVVFNGVTTTYTGDGVSSGDAGEGGFGANALALSIYAEADDSVVLDSPDVVDFHISMISDTDAVMECATP